MDQQGTGEQLKSQMRGEIWQIDLPDGRKELIVQIQITCPQCGNGTLRLMGHHVLGAVEILHKAIELHPDMVKTTITKLLDTTVTGKIPNDPSKN